MCDRQLAHVFEQQQQPPPIPIFSPNCTFYAPVENPMFILNLIQVNGLYCYLFTTLKSNAFERFVNEKH